MKVEAKELSERELTLFHDGHDASWGIDAFATGKLLAHIAHRANLIEYLGEAVKSACEARDQLARENVTLAARIGELKEDNEGGRRLLEEGLQVIKVLQPIADASAKYHAAMKAGNEHEAETHLVALHHASEAYDGPTKGDGGGG